MKAYLPFGDWSGDGHSQYEDVLVVPLNAVYEERNIMTKDIKYFVYKEIGPKKAKKIEIKLGAKDDMQAEIANHEEVGLKEGDKIFLDIKGDRIEVEEDFSTSKTKNKEKEKRSSAALESVKK